MCLYLVILAHVNGKGECWPCTRRLARLSRLSRDTVFRCLKELERSGVIGVARRVRAVSIIRLKPVLSWKLALRIDQIDDETGLNEGPDSENLAQTKDTEQHTVVNSSVPPKDPDVSGYTAKTTNGGKFYEKDFWRWFCSIPFGGSPIHDPDKLPASVRRHSDAKWLLDRAMADRKWWEMCQRIVEEWYSWPWGRPGEKRKLSVGALVKNWQEQVNIGRLEIEQRQRLRILADET